MVSSDPDDLATLLTGVGPRGLIARGLGRSYGDPAQNAGGTVLAPLAARMELDRERGVVRASGGTSFHDLMRCLIPEGYFVPVTPGTRYVTVGGAIACDVHGKNHHRSGSIGNHVVELDLVTADGRRHRVGPDADPDLFWATVGGMGLTGIISSAVISLLPIETGYMSVDTERIADLDELMARIVASDAHATYSVAWIDTLARGRSLGRSVLSVGEHAPAGRLSGRAADDPRPVPSSPRLGAPAVVPPHLISRPAVRAFNELWFRKAPRHREGQLATIASFFHPLDGVADWNRLYGRPGFVQYQFVLPDPAEDRLTRVLERIAAAGHPSFLAVLKRFGPGNPGFLSFPTTGWTLALDLPTHRSLGPLLSGLDREVVDGGGRLYLAKDSRMTAGLLPVMYPRLEEFRQVRDRVDPSRVFQSDLSRRLGL